MYREWLENWAILCDGGISSVRNRTLIFQEDKIMLLQGELSREQMLRQVGVQGVYWEGKERMQDWAEWEVELQSSPTMTSADLTERRGTKMLSALSCIGLERPGLQGSVIGWGSPWEGCGSLCSGSWPWKRWQLKTACWQHAQQLGPEVPGGDALGGASQCPPRMLMSQVDIPGSGLWDRLAGRHELPPWVPGDSARVSVFEKHV